MSNDDEIISDDIEKSITFESVDWITIQKKFDSLQNINSLFYFLRSLVDLLEICTTTECDIFPDLHKIDVMRVDFEVTSLELAKSLPDSRFRKFNTQYQQYLRECKRVFSRIFALKTSREALRKDNEIKHRHFIEYLETCGKYKLPLNMDVSKGVEEKANEMAGQTDLLSPELIEETKRFKAHIKELKKKEKKTEKEE